MNAYHRGLKAKRRRERIVAWLRSPWCAAFAGFVVGTWLAWVCMAPWVVETMRIVQAMWFR